MIIIIMIIVMIIITTIINNNNNNNDIYIYTHMYIPSGKLCHNHGKIHHAVNGTTDYHFP